MLRDLASSRIRQNGNGIASLYDLVRSKELSIMREPFAFGIHHVNVKAPRYLEMPGNVTSNNSGYNIPRNATITAITCSLQNDASATFKIEIRRGINIISIYDFIMTTEANKTIDNLNLDINKDDVLRCALTVGTVAYPEIIIEIAWRI